MDNKLKIREVCGEYALDILFEDMSFSTIYFHSQKMPKQSNALSQMTVIIRCV